MNRRRFLGVLGAGTALASRSVGWATAAVSGPAIDGERLVERWSWVMGQAVHVIAYVRSDDAGLEAIAAALAELRRVDRALSRFDPASDLVGLIDRAGLGPVRVGDDLRAVLGTAERYRAITGGAFDPAIEPLIEAWGFRAQRSEPPTRAELLAARAAVARAVVRIGDRTVHLPNRDTRLDLGGIGVGYGLDRAAQVLRRAGIARAFIDISGDCLALGSPPGERGWKVGITNPDGEGVWTSVRLRDQALATSANTVSVVRYPTASCGHVIDPATGAGAQALLQVSVVAPSGIAADACSTAMLVSGRRPPGVTEIVPIALGPTGR
jgi:thiamine biosynthesis lipoprotein